VTTIIHIVFKSVSLLRRRKQSITLPKEKRQSNALHITEQKAKDLKQALTVSLMAQN
jgi:hypothetical protein